MEKRRAMPARALLHSPDERHLASAVVAIAHRPIIQKQSRNAGVRTRPQIAFTRDGRNPALPDRASASARIDRDGRGTSDFQHRDHPVRHCVRCRLSKIGAETMRSVAHRDEASMVSGRADERGQIVAGAAASAKTRDVEGHAVPGAEGRHSTMRVLIERWQPPHPSPAPHASVTCWRVRAPASMLARTLLSETPWHRQTTMGSELPEMKINFKPQIGDSVKIV